MDTTVDIVSLVNTGVVIDMVLCCLIGFIGATYPFGVARPPVPIHIIRAADGSVQRAVISDSRAGGRRQPIAGDDIRVRVAEDHGARRLAGGGHERVLPLRALVRVARHPSSTEPAAEYVEPRVAAARGSRRRRRRRTAQRVQQQLDLLLRELGTKVTGRDPARVGHVYACAVPQERQRARPTVEGVRDAQMQRRAAVLAVAHVRTGAVVKQQLDRLGIAGGGGEEERRERGEVLRGVGVGVVERRRVVR